MKGKTKFYILLFVIVVGGIIFWWRYYFQFGEGVKGGDLNHLEKKGVLFKTYEGKIIQEGFKTNSPGALQSNEFEFSVEDEKIASELERCSGKFVEVRYKEYRNSLLWRGDSKYIVTEVITVRDPKPQEPFIQK